MSRKRAEETKRSRKLPAAAALVALAALVFVLDGQIYRATQGAEVGLYVTIGMLLLGLSLAGGACILALQVLLRPRRPIGNVVKISRDDDRKAA